MIRVLDAEPDTKLFGLIVRLAHIALERSHDLTPFSFAATQRFTSEMAVAFTTLRTGDPHEARAGFVLALVHATSDVG